MRTSQTIKNTYTVTAGVYAYSAQFPLYETSDVAVHLSKDGGATDTLLTLGTDYTVSIAADNQSGTVTLGVGVADADDILALVSNVPYTQELDLNNVSTIDTEATETQLDRTIQMIQQLKERIDRAVTVAVTDTDLIPDDLRDTLLLAKSEAEQLLTSQAAIDRLYLSAGNIDTVAGDVTNIDTVAGSIANVDAVAADLTNIDAVADDLTNIDTVAGSISDVEAVGQDIDKVTAVADDLTNIDTVAGDLTNIDTAAGSISDINVCAANIEDIEHVSLIVTGVVPVANGGTGVTTVANIQAGKDGNGNTISSTYVKLSGDETIAGTKTFSASPVVPTPSSDSDTTVPATTEWVNDKAADYLPLSGGTMTGTLTFSNGKDIGDYLPLSGGTITGSLIGNVSGGIFTIYNKQSGQGLRLWSGTDFANGASLYLYEKGNASYPGEFSIYAKDSGNTVQLRGKPDGTLTWDGAAVATATDLASYLPLSGGTMTGDITGSKADFAIVKAADTGRLIIRGGSGAFANGASIYLHGKSYSSSAGAFQIYAHNGSNNVSLTGTPDGGLTWTGGVFKLSGNEVKTINLTVTNRELRVLGGTELSDGGSLVVYGTNSSTTPGGFRLRAKGTSDYELVGTNSGGLTWRGQTIQTTSDERLKQDLSAVPDEVLDAWGKVDWQQFKFVEAVAEKGEENCRWHPGLVAQRVKAVFEAEGLDACAYGILCHDIWDDEYDEDGTLVRERGDLWTIRYEEALAMEAAYHRRRADRLEARLDAIEARLAMLDGDMK